MGSWASKNEGTTPSGQDEKRGESASNQKSRHPQKKGESSAELVVGSDKYSDIKRNSARKAADRKRRKSTDTAAAASPSKRQRKITKGKKPSRVTKISPPKAKSNRDDVWEEYYEKFIEYKDREDTDHITADAVRLEEWATTQRREYTKLLQGKRSSLSPERLDKLNAVDFVWDPGEYFLLATRLMRVSVRIHLFLPVVLACITDSCASLSRPSHTAIHPSCTEDSYWHSRFELVRQYGEEHGNCRVGHHYVAKYVVVLSRVDLAVGACALLL